MSHASTLLQTRCRCMHSQLKSSYAHSGRPSGFGLVDSPEVSTSRHIDLLFLLRLLSIFLSRLSIVACISLLRHDILCFISLFFFVGGVLSSKSLPLSSLSVLLITDSSDDMNSAFSTSATLILVALSIVVDLCSAFSLAFAF